MSSYSEKAYWIARAYAFKLSPSNYVDIVHDAFITYHKYKNKNLFEESRALITTCVKNEFWNSMYGTKIRMVNKAITPIIMMPLAEEHRGDDFEESVQLIELYDPNTPESLITDREEKEEYERKYGARNKEAIRLYNETYLTKKQIRKLLL